MRGRRTREKPPLTGEVAAKQAGGAFTVRGGGRPRRGQDPSLRCKRQKGGTGKVEGRACPAPTDCCENLRMRGAREGGSPPSFPLTGCRGRLRAAYMPPLQSCRSPLRGFGGTPEFKVEEGAGALRTDSNTASVLPPPLPTSLLGFLGACSPLVAGPLRRNSGSFLCELSFAAKRKRVPGRLPFPGNRSIQRNEVQ